MDLWILSQDKKELCKINRIFLTGNNFVKEEYKICANIHENIGFIILGEYNSEKRAMEVFNEIKKHIAFLNVEMGSGRFGELDFESDIVFEMPEK